MWTANLKGVPAPAFNSTARDYIVYVIEELRARQVAANTLELYGFAGVLMNLSQYLEQALDQLTREQVGTRS